MKALSLWQPWASAIAVGAKRIETRHWSTKYRGPLAIHAAKRRVLGELRHYQCSWNWCGALKPLGLAMGNGFKLCDELPFGAIVATCELVDCRPTDSFTQAELMTPRRPSGEISGSYDWNENQMGDFSPGRFGWVLEDIRALPEPIPYRGAQGLFNAEFEVSQ